MDSVKSEDKLNKNNAIRNKCILLHNDSYLSDIQKKLFLIQIVNIELKLTYAKEHLGFVTLSLQLHI